MAKAKSPRKSPAAASSSPAKEKKPASAAVQGFDTTLAVEGAAALVGSKATPLSPGAARKESAGFRQLKEGLNQPAERTIDKLLDKTGTSNAKRSSLPYDQTRGQVGHNQTFGADASKSSVPRRTGG